jgi:hypothetical protein
MSLGAWSRNSQETGRSVALSHSRGRGVSPETALAAATDETRRSSLAPPSLSDPWEWSTLLASSEGSRSSSEASIWSAWTERPGGLWERELQSRPGICPSRTPRGVPLGMPHRKAACRRVASVEIDRSATDAVADVGGLWRVDDPNDLQLDLRRQDVEQPTATT